VDKIAELNSMMAAVVKIGTAQKANLHTEPQAGKTGTNQSYRDAWYVGFTAHNVTGVWVGNDDFTPMNQVTGGVIPAPMWKEIQIVADRGLPPTGLPGVPLDASYVQVADAEAPKDAGSDESQAAAIAESPDASAESAVPEQSDDVKNVLNGMFELFEKKPASDPGPTGAQKPVDAKAVAAPKPVAPPKPVAKPKPVPPADKPHKTLFESLFGSKKNSAPGN
jgi:membrane peptidoglycan carboxypeptidase